MFFPMNSVAVLLLSNIFTAELLVKRIVPFLSTAITPSFNDSSMLSRTRYIAEMVSGS